MERKVLLDPPGMEINCPEKRLVCYSVEVIQHFQGVEKDRQPKPAFHRRHVVGTERETVDCQPGKELVQNESFDLLTIRGIVLLSEIGYQERHMLQPCRFPYRPDVYLTADGAGGRAEQTAQFLFAAGDFLGVDVEGEPESGQDTIYIISF